MPTATNEIQKLKFDQYLCGTCDMNSTLIVYSYHPLNLQLPFSKLDAFEYRLVNLMLVNDANCHLRDSEIEV